MILVFKLDYRSSSEVYEKIFYKVLEETQLQGSIVKEHFDLKFYVDAPNAEALESFVELLTTRLPHSIFVHGTEAEVVESMPPANFQFSHKPKPKLPFCPQCLKEVMDPEHHNYYNIFTQCEACGYDVAGETRSYKKEIDQAAKAIKEGKWLEVNTFYNTYVIGLPSARWKALNFDLLSYDLATINTYANVETPEINALGAMEKPFITLKSKTALLMDYEGFEADLIRFKLPDDFILHLLMHSLHALGEPLVCMTHEAVDFDESLHLLDTQEPLEPIEVVASENDLAIVRGEKGLPHFPVSSTQVVPSVGAFYSVIKEHRLQEKHVAGLNLSRDFESTLLIYGEKYGLVEYLTLEFHFDSMQEIFEKIIASNESGVKIVENYKKKFPELFEKVSSFTFEEGVFNIYGLWGIVAMVLGYADTNKPYEAAKVLEESVSAFLGTKGPRIDYKLDNVEGKVRMDPLMTIRTAMSFQLAGVDRLTLCYGVVESFLEFLANELDEIKQNMDITAVAVTGSLLGNRHIFSKLSSDVGKNHAIYFNNELPVEGRNMFFGGKSLE